VVNRTDKAARKRRAKAGTSTVEAVIVLPVMLLLVFGIAEFGISFTRWNSLTNAVREGARAGVVFRSPCDAVPVATLIEDTVSDFADSSGIDPADITTTVTGACNGTGTQLTVFAAVPYDFLVLDSLAKHWLEEFPSSLALSARTVMRNE
jgi:Flp pilus assembly protein TadG